MPVISVFERKMPRAEFSVKPTFRGYKTILLPTKESSYKGILSDKELGFPIARTFPFLKLANLSKREGGGVFFSRRSTVLLAL